MHRLTVLCLLGAGAAASLTPKEWLDRRQMRAATKWGHAKSLNEPEHWDPCVGPADARVDCLPPATCLKGRCICPAGVPNRGHCQGPPPHHLTPAPLPPGHRIRRASRLRGHRRVREQPLPERWVVLSECRRPRPRPRPRLGRPLLLRLPAGPPPPARLSLPLPLNRFS